MDQQKETSLQLFEHEKLQYYIYYDFICLISVASESQAVLEYFQDIPNHPMIRIAINRLILQVNLSNSVYVNQYENCQNHQQLNLFKKDIAQKCKAIFQLITKKELVKLITHFVERNLCLHNTICQIQIEETQIQKHDYSQALQTLVQAMGTIQIELETLSKEHKHNVPSLEKLIALAKYLQFQHREKYEQAKIVLGQNFPDIQSQQIDNFHISQEEQYTDQSEYYEQQQQQNHSLIKLLDLINTYIIMKNQRSKNQETLEQFLQQSNNQEQLIKQIDCLNYKNSTTLQELFKQMKNGLKKLKLKNINFEYSEIHQCMIKNLLEFYSGNIEIKLTKNFIKSFYQFLIDIKDTKQASQKVLESQLMALRNQPSQKVIIQEITNFKERIQTTDIAIQLENSIGFITGSKSQVQFKLIVLNLIQDWQLFELVLQQ